MNNPTISMIAAMDESRGIGYQGKIPWHIKEDLVRFKNLTLNHTIIIGRKTFESLIAYYKRSGRPMPKRNTIIVTRNKELMKKVALPDIYIAPSIEQAINKGRELEKEEIFLSGGAQIFTQGIKYATKLYLTIVNGKFVADAFFPDYSEFKNKVFEESHTSHDLHFIFTELSR